MITKPTLQNLDITFVLFNYLMDGFMDDLHSIIRHELGEDWLFNNLACPEDHLSVISAACDKYFSREFPEKVADSYEELIQEELYTDDERI